MASPSPTWRLTVLLALAGLTACNTGERGLGSSFAIVDTTVINPRRSQIRPHSTVTVQKGVIRAVGPASMSLPKRMRRIDGRGRFLIPGLWDAHTHLSKTGRQSLALFIANGVTGIRDMGSNLDEVATWKRMVARGDYVGPIMFISGPMLEYSANLDRMAREGGVEAFTRQRIGVENPEDGRKAVKELARAGVDQIKMRTTPDLATFHAVSQEAAAEGLPFAAHPPGATEELLGTGVDSLEHLLEPAPTQRTSVQRAELLDGIARSGIQISNTLVNLEGLLTPFELGTLRLASRYPDGDPYRRYLCGYILRDWAEQLEENRGSPFRQLIPVLNQYARDLHELHARGAPLLAGSDAGVMFVYPGFSLHDELEIMVRDVGLTSMETLRIATDGVPAYFHTQSTMGAVEAGQAANLVLLDADPLTDIRNTRRIGGVVASGHWFDRTVLDGLLAATERDAGKRCTGGSTAGMKPSKLRRAQ